MKSLMSILIAVAGIYLILMGLIYFFQDKLLFMPFSELVQTPESVGMSAQDFWVETTDGIRIHGWYFSNDDAEYVIVLSHGNAGNISYRLDIAKALIQSGASVLMYDYRGYGQSEGTPTEQGLYNDIQAVIDGLINHMEYAENQILMYGRSLGGAVAAYAAANRNVGGLVLDSAFLDLKTMVRDVYPFVPVKLAKYNFPTRKYVPEERSYPVMVMHSPEDDIVGFHHGELLYQQIKEPKRFVRLRGGHNNNFSLSKDTIVSSWRWYLDEVSKKGK